MFCLTEIESQFLKYFSTGVQTWIALSKKQIIKNIMYDFYFRDFIGQYYKRYNSFLILYKLLKRIIKNNQEISVS